MLYKLGRSVAKEWMNKRGNYSADLSDYNIGGDSHELNHPFTTPSLLQIAPPLQLPCAAGDQLPSTSPLPPRGPHPRCAALPIDPCSRPTTRACRLPPCDCSRSSQQGRRQLAKQQQIITAGTPSTPKAAADHHSRDAVNAQSSSRSSQQGRRQLAKQHGSSQHRRGTKKRIHCIVRLPTQAQSNSRSSQQRRSRLAQHRRLHSQIVEQRDSVITSKVCQSHAQRRHYVHQ